MSRIVNLRTVRKQAGRATRRAEADENAARHGRTRAQAEREAADAERARAHLDAHRREREE